VNPDPMRPDPDADSDLDPHLNPDPNSDAGFSVTADTGPHFFSKKMLTIEKIHIFLINNKIIAQNHIFS
jgi:hypothetical protein